MKRSITLVVLFIALFVVPFQVGAQNFRERRLTPVYPYSARIYDSVMASSIPVLEVPLSRLKATLPESVDNSENDYWPGLLDQYQFYSCQQYAGVAYTFGYELNRLRGTHGWYWENRIPAHYTWNFLNQGERYYGVNFLHSFDVIRQQGHMTNLKFGEDTAGSYLGWKTGYDKYLSGMTNRLKQVYSIPINNANGINLLRNYLFDHLDGSATGGIACFTTDSWFEMGQLPPGTPDAGKNVQLWWHPTPDHGLCIVGYNDSIRYDVNGDGLYTNNIDINGDGIVDARDWEIGGFKFANSWGYWWCDFGFAYVLYSAMASNYEEGGVWNNRVYIVEADTGYLPLLTAKVKIDYNKRQRIRLIAGVNADTLAVFPDHTITFPIFNFQGGDHVMSGQDGGAGSQAVELGLDITPLLNWFPASGSARLFLGVEERDPDQSGSGSILRASFIRNTPAQPEFIATTTAVDILDNDLTLVSGVASVPVSRVQITTTGLPPYQTDQPYEVQLAAIGGTEPYTWSLHENYSKQPFSATVPSNTGTPLTKISDLRPYAAKALPFPFPFYGVIHDSIYINFNGFVTFDPQALPAPYISDELAMMKMFRMIGPAFSQFYSYVSAKNDGVFYQADASAAVIWWKTSVTGHENNSNNNFALILYPDGRFEFRYGIMDTAPVLSTIYTGISKGDNHNSDVAAQWNANTLAGKATRYLPMPGPADIRITPYGQLSVKKIDTSQIYAIPVTVTDEQNLSDSRLLIFSSGLSMTHEVVCGDDGRLKFGEPASLKLFLENSGQSSIENLTIRLQSMDPCCEVTDSLITVPHLNPEEPLILPDVFHFSLTKPMPCDYPVRLVLRAQCMTRTWNYMLDIPVAAPQLEFLPPRISDGDNNMLDPGEITDIMISLKNSGNLKLQNVALQLESMDPLVQVQSPSIEIINLVNPLTQHTNYFRLQVSRSTPLGHTVSMRITASCDTTVYQRLDFSLPVGKKPVALIDLATSTSSMTAMQQALNTLGVEPDSLRTLNVELSNYSAVFLILGNATQGTHALNAGEAAQLEQYLQKNGNLYMEGYFTWYYSNNTVLHPYFKYTTAICPQYTFSQAGGILSTFTDGMSFNYSGSPNFAQFTFVPVNPAYSTFVNADTPGRTLEIVYSGADYKTIGTFLEFASMTDGAEPSTRRTLMQRYLDFFGLNLSGPHPLFHADHTEVCQGSAVNFTDDSFDNIQSWQWEFTGGAPGSSNEPNPVVHYDVPGTFDVKLTVSDGVNTRSLTRKNYISVNVCTGGEEFTQPSPFKVFPNPAHEKIWIEPNHEISGKCRFTLYDLAGRKVSAKEINTGNVSKRIEWNLSGLRKGIYFLRMQGDGHTGVQKVVVK